MSSVSDCKPLYCVRIHIYTKICSREGHNSALLWATDPNCKAHACNVSRCIHFNFQYRNVLLYITHVFLSSLYNLSYRQDRIRLKGVLGHGVSGHTVMSTIHPLLLSYSNPLPKGN